MAELKSAAATTVVRAVLQSMEGRGTSTRSPTYVMYVSLGIDFSSSRYGTIAKQPQLILGYVAVTSASPLYIPSYSIKTYRPQVASFLKNNYIIRIFSLFLYIEKKCNKKIA